jgi:hypothetical protein
VGHPAIPSCLETLNCILRQRPMRGSRCFPPVSDPFLTALIAATYVHRTASETFQT